MKAFQPSAVEIIRTAIRARQADVRTSIPAVVKSYDATTQTCSCELAVWIPTHEGEWEGTPPLEDVPVVWPRGGGYFCTMPLAAGDAGLLVFSEVDFSAWRELGQDFTVWREVLRPKVSDAAQVRRHGMYGYFVPGGCASGKEISGASASKLVIGKDGGPVMKIDDTGLELGAMATAFAAKADAVDANLTALNTWLAAHTHTATALASPTSPPIVAPPSPTSVACSKVKVE
jgi:hypothetical protein